MSSVETATATPAKQTPPAATPVPRPEPAKVIKPGMFGIGDYLYADFAVTLPVGWTPEDALKPEVWVQVAHKFAKDSFTQQPDRTGAIIAVRTEDHAFYARLYVRAVQERGLVVEIMKPDANGICWFGPKEIKSTAYEPKWNVGARGYDIRRISDGAIVADASKIKTKEQAQAWINAS